MFRRRSFKDGVYIGHFYGRPLVIIKMLQMNFIITLGVLSI